MYLFNEFTCLKTKIRCLGECEEISFNFSPEPQPCKLRIILSLLMVLDHFILANRINFSPNLVSPSIIQKLKFIIL